MRYRKERNSQTKILQKTIFKSIRLVVINSFFILLVGSVIFFHSCANPGAGPSGGPRDSIAPIVLRTIPEPYALNYTGKEIQIDFDEYVVANTLTNSVVISPPLAERINVRTKGKSVIIKIDEDLVPGRTYSIDFKDGIKDYNEGNVLEGFRMLFSTYDRIDTLRISGYMVDAFTLEPVENALVSLYSIDNDSIFSTLRPDFIARPDETGFFLFDNLPEGSYRLYGLVDEDRDLMFSKRSEKIAFIDTLLTPSAQYIHQIDTLFEENDTIISKGYTEFSPGPVSTYLFSEDYFEQYVAEYKREPRNRMQLVFNESLSDSFAFDIPGVDAEQLYVEFGKNRDSLRIWLNDSIAVSNDSLYMALRYTATDTLGQFISKADTLKMFFSDQRQSSKGMENDEAEPTKQNGFSFSTNIKSGEVDLNAKIQLISPDPLRSFTKEDVRVEVAVTDSTYETVPFELISDEDSKRKYGLDFTLDEQTVYRVQIDSARVQTVGGMYNMGFSLSFRTRAIEYYGTAIFTVRGFEGSAIVQLLSNNENEDVIRTKQVAVSDKEITLSYLPPGRYRFKLIDDRNGNGKWDTGSLAEGIQPEMVYYFPKVLEIKSNWDIKEDWEIDLSNVLPKDIYDAEAKEKERANGQGRR